MAQNELPTFYGERTKDGNTIQRTVENNADSEPVVMPSSPVPKPQPAHEPRRIEFQPQDAGHPRHRSRYDNDFEEHRRLPHRSESVQYDYWDRAARRRAARDRYDRDVDSGYEDYYGDRRSMTDDFRRRRSTRTSRPPMSRFNGDHAGSYPENTGGETPLQIDAPLRLPWTMWMNSDIKNRRRP